MSRLSQDDVPADASPGTVGGAPRIVIVLVVAAVLVTVGAIATGFVLASRIGGDAATGPLAIPSTPAPGAEGRYCTDVMEALPDSLDGQERRELLVAEPGVAGWGDPAVVLRCGLTDPAELTCFATITTITNAAGDSVEWLRIAQGSAVTFLAVDRPVRIAVTVPDTAGLTPVQEMSDVIAATLPARPVCSGGDVTPVDNG